MKKIDIAGYTLLTLVFGLGLYFGFTDPDYFNTVFTVEDGLVEYGTTAMMLLVSLLCLYRLIRLWRFTGIAWKIGVLGFALLFFFGAGEEISWGQRIFNVESGEFFLKNNAQSETNLHNLVVSGKKINKLIFSQLLLLVMIVYLLILPVLYRKTRRIALLADRFAVPVVKWHHTIAFVLATLLVLLIPSDRKWEVYELAFGLLFFLIFLHPFNAAIYRKKASFFS